MPESDVFLRDASHVLVLRTRLQNLILLLHILPVLGHRMDLRFTVVFILLLLSTSNCIRQRVTRHSPQPVNLLPHIEDVLLVAQVHHRVVLAFYTPFHISQGEFIPRHRHITAHNRDVIRFPRFNIRRLLVVEHELYVPVPHLVHDALHQRLQLVDRRSRVEQPDDVPTAEPVRRQRRLIVVAREGLSDSAV